MVYILGFWKNYRISLGHTAHPKTAICPNKKKNNFTYPGFTPSVSIWPSGGPSEEAYTEANTKTEAKTEAQTEAQANTEAKSPANTEVYTEVKLQAKVQAEAQANTEAEALVVPSFTYLSTS